MIGIRIGMPLLAMILSLNCTQHCIGSVLANTSPWWAGGWGMAERPEKSCQLVLCCCRAGWEGMGALAGYRAELLSLRPSACPGRCSGYPCPGDAGIRASGGMPGVPALGDADTRARGDAQGLHAAGLPTDPHPWGDTGGSSPEARPLTRRTAAGTAGRRAPARRYPAPRRIQRRPAPPARLPWPGTAP